jgi:hypothetical protein
MTKNKSIELRMPVWVALSHFYLDTTLGEQELRQIAYTLASGPFTESEYEDILRDEIMPVCQRNLLDIAGEWAGFDEAWLREKLVPRINKRSNRVLGWLRLNALPSKWPAVRKQIGVFRNHTNA